MRFCSRGATTTADFIADDMNYEQLGILREGVYHLKKLVIK